jgi:cytoskeletal protein CcmA (bactofilin family)
MFSKTRKQRAPFAESKPVVKSPPPSIISTDLKIVGDLSSDGEIQIDGAVDGDIRTKSLLVGETAHIKGDVVADSIFIHGSTSGQIKSRSVNLSKTARVVGDILHEDLVIDAGAFLEGRCKPMVAKKERPDAKINVVSKDDPAPHPDKARKKGTMESKGNASGEAKDNGHSGGGRL